MRNYSYFVIVICWPFKHYPHQVVNFSPLPAVALAEIKVVLRYVVRKLNWSGGGEHCFSFLVTFWIVLLIKSLKIEGYCLK